jgi:S-adenosyl-L-methionine hydrolase (adenosine-forming)
MEPVRPNPLITLTTDFGLEDHYAGTMKGVILARCPHATVVDISHNVPSFSVWSGAYTIDQAAPYFPSGTIHIVVIDPGVGTDRKPILVQAIQQYFIAPDNGVLSLVVRRETGHAVVREIANRELFLPRSSSTFHGRDVFAPVAAALAAGIVQTESVGPLLSDMEVLDSITTSSSGPQQWTGAVLSVDHFGNVITNFKASEFPSLSSGSFELQTSKQVVSTLRATFGGAPAGSFFAFLGSSGYIELGINQGNAAQSLQLSPGDSLLLRLR